MDDLKKAKALFEAGGALCELVNLNDALAGVDHGADEPAAAVILIIRGGVSALLQKSGKTADEAFEEQKRLL